ncbi:type II restriction endonuclease [Algimonas ampicilliniresistens]|uniref:Type II restriction endonuclease n=1 Tax=Algimonas ampicilliniresistens TaxID=1298735 RepID=A0ABQ5VBW2_9PROT|nr:XamI family restriction endonuclease [Algimonas ampicilliniresistens]GLQ23887.1 type II restriction endonuclease [Algimonas ampicilliniresistens]
MSDAPEWTEAQLKHDRDLAVDFFRESRRQEPLEVYGGFFETYQGLMEELLEETVDLTHLDEAIVELMADEDKQYLVRYLSGPPVSADDLKTMLDTSTLSAVKFKTDPELSARLIEFIRDWHDRRRFPWLSGDWEPEEDERRTAVIATAAMVAMQKTQTARRSKGSTAQEMRVVNALIEAGLVQVDTRTVRVIQDAPIAGEFCRESVFAGRKADIIIGLWDNRTMAIECKVSNSAVNSIKRLNGDAAVKAGVWIKAFGTHQVVPAAVLEGVYDVHNLVDAQSRDLTLFWAHDLDQLIAFVESTRPSG